MKILLTYPPVSFTYNRIRDAGMAPHMSLLCIASHLYREFDDLDITIIDGHHENMDKIKACIRGQRPDLIGYSVDFTNYENAVRLSSYAKEENPSVWNIVGSNHATNLWKEILMNRPEIDFVSLGDGEPSWEDIVLLRRGDLQINKTRNIAYRSPEGPVKSAIQRMNLKDMAPVNYSLIRLEDYFALQKKTFDEGFRMLQFTSQRGCANKPLCVFCGRYTDGIRFRDPGEYAREIAEMTEKYDLTEVWDRSDSFIQNVRWLNSFAKELDLCTDRFRTGKTTFKTYARADQLLREDVIETLKRLGFRMVFIGYEAGDDRILRNIGKHANLDVYRKATENVLRAGMDIDASFIVGLPGENRESLDNHLKFVRELIDMGLDKIRVNRLLVLPGTPLYAAVMKTFPELQGKDIISQEELQDRLFMTSLYDLSDFGGKLDVFKQALRDTASAMTDAVTDIGGGAEGYGYGKNQNILSGIQLQGKEGSGNAQ